MTAEYHHVPLLPVGSVVKGSIRTVVLSKSHGIVARIGKAPGSKKLNKTVVLLFDKGQWALPAAKDWATQYKTKMKTNPSCSRAESVAGTWLGFPSRGKHPVKMSRQLSGALVVLGEVHHIGYLSDKFDGKKKGYRHAFGARSRPPLLYDPKNHYLIIPGPPIAGVWKVTGRGIEG